jgi:hypothetical protein
MTSKRERLEVFTIEDNIQCTQEELLQRAENIAADLSAANGWRAIEVHCIAKNPENKDGYLRYEFEILGAPNEGTTKAEGKDKTNKEEFSKAAAPRDVGI